MIEKLNIPNSCKIDKKLFKKQFIENFSLKANQKKILSEDVKNITLEYLLNKNSININPFVDEEYDYSEIAFIRVELATVKRVKKLIDIIQLIPYPLIVFFTCRESICINMSPKRINKNDSTKLVVEEDFISKWINLESLTKIEKDFLDSLDLRNHPFTNFFELYKSYLDRLIAFNASKYSGTLSHSEDTHKILQEIQKLEASINDIISKIKKEDNIRKKVNLNIELKKLSDKLDSLKSKI